MKFRVLGQRVVVVPHERKAALSEEAIKLGIVAPDSFIPEPEVSGEVVQVGSGVTTVTVGNTVYFSPHSGWEAQVGDKRMLVIPEESILAVGEV